MRWRPSLWGYAAGLAAAVVSGLFVAVGKELERTSPPLVVGSVIYAAGALVLLPVALVTRQDHRRAPWPLLVGWALLGAVAGPACFFFGLHLASGTTAALLSETSTMFTVVLAWTWLGERRTATDVMAAAVVVGGGLALAWLSHRRGAAVVWGDVLVTVAYLIFAVENILSRQLVDPVPPPRLGVIKTGLAGLGLGALAWLTGEGPWPPPSHWLLILLGGGGGMGVSIVLYYVAQARVGAAVAGVLAALGAWSGALLSWALLGERLTAAQVAAGLVMLAGAAWLVVARTRPTAG